jgi:glycosyltransferase involved in cell wall biosynthesis
MNIYGWVPKRDGCSYYRVEVPLYGLKSGGHNVMAGTKFSRTALREMSPEPWIVVAQRLVNPQNVHSGDASLIVHQVAADPNFRLVFETDDDLLNVPYSNRAHELYEQDDVRRALKDHAKLADLVTVSTEPLAEVMREFNPNVVVLPNYIDGALIDFETPRPETDRVVIGWAGTSTHTMDFQEAGLQVARFLRRNQDVVWHSIGADLLPPTPNTRLHTPWFNSVTDYYGAAKFDIGIAPLYPHRFNMSKSYIKALEYAAMGIPVVASNYGPYRDFVKHGETGFLVKRDHQWAMFLGELVNDADLRARMAKAAKEYVRAFTIQEHWPKWAEAYGSLL